jgi:hypothetical protein
VAELLAHADAWKKAQHLREYLAAVRRAAEELAGGPIGERSEVAKQLGWAERQADRLDPLVG